MIMIVALAEVCALLRVF